MGYRRIGGIMIRRLPTLALVAVALASVAAGCSGDDGEQTLPPLSIVLTIDEEFPRVEGSTSCVGTVGDADLYQGQQAVLRDDSGKTLAIGRVEKGLDLPVGEGPPFAYAQCSFDVLRLRDVPDDLRFYDLDIGGQDATEFERRDIEIFKDGTAHANLEVSGTAVAASECSAEGGTARECIGEP